MVVTGLSMGGSLTLWTALQHPEIAGIVCVNPATRPQAADVLEMVQELIDEGNEVMPGIGGDIADPDVVESAYPGTPLRPLFSFQTEGLAPMAERYDELTMPALIITSRQDHVIDPSDSEHLAATLGGEVEHVWLERSYHVATQDYDRDAIVDMVAQLREAGDVLIASIPSPSFNSIDIGPLSLNLYGLAIALGVIAAVWLFGRRLEERGAGTRDDASGIAIWAVLAGVIGARLYHVATDIEKFRGDWGKVPAIWEGGLGIPGGLVLGTVVGLYVTHRRGINMAVAATCAAPAIPLAQAIGRWGNYFNQELYGRPTTLPWGLEIDADHLASRLRRRHDVPPDVPLRIAVVPRPVLRPAVDRSSIPAGPRPAHGDVLHRLRHRPVLDRGHAHRRGRPGRRAPLQPVGRRRDGRRRHDRARGVAPVPDRRTGTAVARSVRQTKTRHRIEQMRSPRRRSEAHEVADRRAAQPVDPGDDVRVGALHGAVEVRLGTEFLDDVDGGVEPARRRRRRDRSVGCRW